MAKTTTKTTDEDEDQRQDKTGAEDDDDEDEGAKSGGTEGDGDEDDDEDDDDDASILATLTPAQAKLFQRVDQERSAASKQARERRLALKALRSGGSAAGGPKPAAPKTEGAKDKTEAPDFEAFKTQLLAELKGTQDASRIESAAEKALKRAGLVLPEDEDAAERKLKRVMRMLDLEGVEPGEVADEVADLKADNPELFGRVRKARPKTGGLGGPAKIVGSPRKNAAEELFD